MAGPDAGIGTAAALGLELAGPGLSGIAEPGSGVESARVAFVLGLAGRGLLSFPVN